MRRVRTAIRSVLAIASLAYCASALALSGSDTLRDWSNSSRSEQMDLVEAMILKTRRAVSAGDLHACIDEVASDSSLGAQQLSSVAAGCIVLLEG